MQAEYDSYGWRLLVAQALRADGNAAITADLVERAHAPAIVRPWAMGCWPPDSPFFFAGAAMLFALNFAFGVRRRRIPETDAMEF
jgi:hypothetical protein